MYLSASNVSFLVGIRDGEIKEALANSGVTALCAELIYNQIQTTPPYEYLVRVLVTKENSLAWVLRSSYVENDTVSVFVASGIRKEESADVEEEMDVGRYGPAHAKYRCSPKTARTRSSPGRNDIHRVTRYRRCDGANLRAPAILGESLATFRRALITRNRGPLFAC